MTEPRPAPRKSKREQLLDELSLHYETIQECGSAAEQQRRGSQAAWNVPMGGVPFEEDDKEGFQFTPAPRIVDEIVKKVGHAHQRIPQILEDLGPLTSDEELMLRHVAKGLSSFPGLVLKPGGGPALEQPPTASPKKYLFGWAEIAAELDQANDEAFQKRIKAMHDRYESPIIFGGTGTPPRVEGVKLIEWWNSLDDKWREHEQRRLDREHTVRDTYPHGRDETVVPEIKGHEKLRRKPTS